MKIRLIASISSIAIFAIASCDKHSPDIKNKIAELEQKNKEAAGRQLELERQLEDQKLAAERDAVERERAQIEEDRAELERQQGEAQAEKDAALKAREEALAKREGKLEQLQSTLEEKEDELNSNARDLSAKDADLAGREALPFEEPVQTAPVADYGTFYDSLSSYGSWFETPDYGYVWQPAAVREVDWRPYSRGRWVCSDRGWTWLSDEPFGWATYHYGRWARIKGHGWIWVPGTEWAPCWVSWRENDSHIGWAPLPPETLAWRGRGWDHTVDVQFGIAASCFNFVEIRYFGTPLHRRCLPISGNTNWFGNTINITYIHITNRQVICGGPRYKTISDRIGKPLPFYRLEVDHHPRITNGPLALRPQVSGGRLRVSAPNMDSAWNEGLKPKQIRGRIETVSVERTTTLSREITERFEQSRQQDRQRAEKSITDLGGRERFEERRTAQLQENRRQLDSKQSDTKTRDVLRKSDGNPPQNPDRKEQPQVVPPREITRLPEGVTRNTDRKPTIAEERDRNSGITDKHVIAPPPDAIGDSRKQTDRIQGDDKRTDSKEGRVTQEKPEIINQPDHKDTKIRQPQPNEDRENALRQQQEQARQAQLRQADETRRAQVEGERRNQEKLIEQKQMQERQLKADEARQAQQELERNKQQEIARQRLDQERQQREQQAREAQRQAMEQQREQARQQEAARESARRQQQEQQQEAARQESRRQQEQARQQEQSRQQEQARQRQQENDQNESRKRNR